MRIIYSIIVSFFCDVAVCKRKSASIYIPIQTFDTAVPNNSIDAVSHHSRRFLSEGILKRPLFVLLSLFTCIISYRIEYRSSCIVC